VPTFSSQEFERGQIREAIGERTQRNIQRARHADAPYPNVRAVGIRVRAELQEHGTALFTKSPPLSAVSRQAEYGGRNVAKV
jgi:hypothetical protein